MTPNDLSKLSEGSVREPLRVRAGRVCRKRHGREQAARGHRILPSYSVKSGESPEAKSEASRSIQIAGYYLIFLATALALLGAVAMIIAFCLGNKPVLLFFAVCLAILTAYCITQF